MQKQTVLNIIFGTALILSLTANVAAAGAFGGGATPVLTKIASAMTAFADLSPDSRAKTIDAVKKDWPDIQKQLATLRDKRGAVKEALAKPDYKRADAEVAMADIRAQTAVLQEKAQSLALDVADNLTAEERAHIIQTLDIAP